MAAAEIARLVSRSKLPMALNEILVKCDASTMGSVLDRIVSEQPDSIYKWLVMNQASIVAPQQET
jgi:hypothetical protein